MFNVMRFFGIGLLKRDLGERYGSNTKYFDRDFGRIYDG